MIPENFYPTATSFGCGVTEDEFTDSLTNGIHLISDFMTNKCNAYWLGYISKDNLPMAFRYSMATYDTENGFIFREATDEDNFPCGYCTGNKGIGSFNASPEYEVNQAYSDGAVCPSNYAHVALFNSLHPEYSGYGNYTGTSNFPHLIFQCYLYDSNEQLVAVRNESIAFNYKDLYDFLNGENTATLLVLGHSVLLSSDDLETGTCYKETDDNYFVRLFLTNYNFSCRLVLNGSYEAPHFLPSFMVHTTFNDGLWSGMFFGNQGVCIGNGTIARVLNNDVQWSYYWWSSYGGARAGLDGQIPYDDYIALINDGNTYGFLYDNNVLLAKSGSDYWFYPIFPIAEVKKHFSLMYRIDVSANGDTTSYVFGLSYATDVSETNEFLARLKTGNITNPAFKNSLRPWQYSDIAVNEFTKDDVPPYEPPEPPAEGEESGDRIPPQIRYFTGTTNFITQYAMKNVHVSTFGHLLWTSWVDSLSEPTDMWKNFVLAGQSFFNTGSVNVSDAIQFIVSLKLFPFNIPNTTLDSLTNSVIIGTGAFPIEVENIYRINSPLIYLDFGSVLIPRPYGDFRDYDNMKISIVLPYCGTSELNPGDVVGKTLRCRYAIDLQSGSCTAMVTTWDSEGELYPVAQLDGQIGCTIPLTATNTGQLASRVLTDASNVASLVHDKTFGRIESGFKDMSGFLSGGESFSGDWGTASLSPLSIKPDASGLANALSRPAISCPSISGGAGLASFIQPKAPFVQMRYGLYDEPGNYNHAVGKPSTGNGSLSSYTGYVVCANVDVSSLTCHTDEKAAIKAALESGVYV